MTEIRSCLDRVVRSGAGRPTRADKRSSSRLEIVMTDDERIELDRVAVENGMPVSSVVREAVNTFVQDYREKIVFIARRSR
jgi:hypothetical protein